MGQPSDTASTSSGSGTPPPLTPHFQFSLASPALTSLILRSHLPLMTLGLELYFMARGIDP